MLPLLLTLAASADTGDTGACSDPDLTWVEGSCVSNYGGGKVCSDPPWYADSSPRWSGTGMISCSPGSDVGFILWREEPETYAVTYHEFYDEEGCSVGSIHDDYDTPTCCDGLPADYSTHTIPLPRCIAPTLDYAPGMEGYGSEFVSEPETGCASASSRGLGLLLPALSGLFLLGLGRRR